MCRWKQPEIGNFNRKIMKRVQHTTIYAYNKWHTNTCLIVMVPFTGFLVLSLPYFVLLSLCLCHCVHKPFGTNVKHLTFTYADITATITNNNDSKTTTTTTKTILTIIKQVKGQLQNCHQCVPGKERESHSHSI